jgi:hypothetical protein
LVSHSKADCPTGVTGLCEPGVTEVIEETVTEEVTQDSTGITTITTTVTDTTTTTVTNEDSGNILDSNSSYVTTSKEGDMDYDWGGEGPASMPSGTYCGQLGTDRCAEITGSGNNTSRMGVSGMGSTFYQTINISDLEIDRGGRTNYTIKVNKSDPQDRIYMHITGKDGNVQRFAGTDILSETGVTTGYQEYSGGFDFSGGLTTLIVEVGGRDINLAVGPIFDDVTINVLYNVVNTIVTQTITSVEMFVALNIDASDEVIDVVENIFENNDIVDDTSDFNFEPIEESQEEISIETVEMEMELELDFSMDIESEMEIPMETLDTEESPVEVQVAEVEEELEVEVEVVDEKQTAEAKTEETKEQPKEIKKAEVKKEAKQKAANKIVKKMGDKGKYDSQNQLKTLVVMQVLGNSKDFFNTQQNLPDIQGFFTDTTLPDGTIPTNNMAQYFLFGGSNSAHDALVTMQYE